MRRRDPSRRSTPLEEWPPRDREAWLVAQSPADPFDPVVGFALRWRPVTRQLIVQGYGRWLGWLERTGQLDPDEAPGERASRQRLDAYREMLRQANLADNSVAGRIQQLANALRAIAPTADWGWIHRASGRLYASAVLVRDPTLRIQPAEQVIALGYDLMYAAENEQVSAYGNPAAVFRDGLLIAFVVQRPFRRLNLTTLSLGTHLEKRRNEWRLHFSASETKNGEVIDCAWPLSLVDPLHRYLTIHRPRLLQRDRSGMRPTNRLWVSQQGGAMTGGPLNTRVVAHTRERFGQPINLHTMRHIAATTIATEDPAGAADIRSVLGHVSMRSSETHYNRAKMLGAGTALQATIAKLRRGR